jgi:hypothetical protein
MPRGPGLRTEQPTIAQTKAKFQVIEVTAVVVGDT